MENVSERRFSPSRQRRKTGRRFCRSSFLCLHAAAGGAGRGHSVLCVTAQKLPWWMSVSFLLRGNPWSPWVWKLVKTDIFSQSEMWAHLMQAHWGLSSLYTFGPAVTLSSPVRGCGTEFVGSFLLFVLNMLLLIPLDYSFCITRNRNYLFPFLHLCHSWCFAPSSPPSCVSHLNL